MLNALLIFIPWAVLILHANRAINKTSALFESWTDAAGAESLKRIKANREDYLAPFYTYSVKRDWNRVFWLHFTLRKPSTPDFKNA